MKIRPAVKALVERDDKILVLKTETEGSSYWVLPGGKIEYGEEPVEALRREIKEEISTDSDIGKPVGMYYFLKGENDDGDQIVLTVFEADITGEVDISSNPADEDISEYVWMKPEQLVQKSENESLKQFISKHFDLPKK